MRAKTQGPVLDRFRLAAAVLVVCIHTSPLATYTPLGDLWLTRILARVAVPFFLMLSGACLAQQNWRTLGRFWKRTLVLYLCAAALYLPLNWYSGTLPRTLGQGLRQLLVDGTFYTLWYFPAVLLGVLVARGLHRLGLPAALTVAGLLYLVGLGGDSYYGLLSSIPAFETLYGGIFSLWEYTRNGLFYVPLFLLLGTVEVPLSRKSAWIGTGMSLALMTAEGLWLHSLGAPRHDSMYLALPVCMVYLFALLRGANAGRDRRCARWAALVYLVHPWCIVLVRGSARARGLEKWLVENSLGHFLAVLALSLGAAAVLDRLRPLPLPRTLRAWREMDESAAVHNARAIQKALGSGCRMMAVLKADGYGHGAVAMARALAREGIRDYAVACLSEGIALRRKGIRGTILILGYTPPEAAPLLGRWRLTQTVADEAHGLALSRQGVKVEVHLALDTGMHRLGLPAEDREAIARMYRLPHLRIRGVFSHLCVSDSPAPEDQAFTQRQLERFYGAVERLRQDGLDPGQVHIQASYGIWNLPPQPCTLARAGILLYGVGSDETPTVRDLELRPVLSLRTRVASVRTVPAGEGAGYGLAFRARRDTRLAVLTVGYGDGLPRELSQRGGRVLIAGRSCPMVGRMCMDQLLVDVTDVPQAVPGAVATLVGRDGEEQIPLEELAGNCGTLTNELLSQLSPRLPLVRTRDGH